LPKLGMAIFLFTIRPKNLDFKEPEAIFDFYGYTFVYKVVVLIFAVLLEE
jgi:hypothetical protein